MTLSLQEKVIDKGFAVLVIVLSVVPERLVGVLTRWLMQIDTGVYVGRVSARVRELLWTRIESDMGNGHALMIWPARNEQHMEFRVHNHKWTPEDYDGITLIKRPLPHASFANTEHQDSPRTRSLAGRRRRFSTGVEQRHRYPPQETSE